MLRLRELFLWQQKGCLYDRSKETVDNTDISKQMYFDLVNVQGHILMTLIWPWHRRPQGDVYRWSDTDVADTMTCSLGQILPSPWQHDTIPASPGHSWASINRDDSRLVPSQWETSLQSNAVSHWLGANLESALIKRQTDPASLMGSHPFRKSGIILGMGSANERWHYNVMSSLIGWAHTQNDPCESIWNLP